MNIASKGRDALIFTVGALAGIGGLFTVFLISGLRDRYREEEDQNQRREHPTFRRMTVRGAEMAKRVQGALELAKTLGLPQDGLVVVECCECREIMPVLPNQQLAPHMKGDAPCPGMEITVERD